VIFNHDPQLHYRIINFAKPFLQTTDDMAKTVVLNKKQEFFLRFAVMIKTSEAYVSRPRDVAH
jgi:hypothetical protein